MKEFMAFFALAETLSTPATLVDVGIVVVDGIVEDGRSWWWNRCFRNLYESADGLAVFGK